jgi:PKD repeat protein
MRSRKALVAVVLLMSIVCAGVLVGLTGTTSSSQGSASVPYPTTQGLGATYAGGAVFGAAVSSRPYSPFGNSVSTTTVTAAGATTTVATVTSLSSTVASGPGATVVVQPNQQPQAASAIGARLAAAPGANGSRDIEFFTNVTLQAASSSSAFSSASAIAYSVGGYIAYSSETNSTALIEMRVPAANYQDALAQVEALGTLVNLESSSNDVTVQYTDLNATLLSLRAEQSSLLAILSQSTNINSTLNVESRIQGVDQQINSVQSEILQTKTLVSYATISAFIEEKAPAQPLTIKVTATPRSGDSPLSVTFNAIAKGGNQPYIVNYNFGDGSSYQGQALIHTYEQPGHYNVTVTATDASANVTEGWTTVDVGAPPATSSVGGFPNFVGGLFLQVVEGIVEVAVVVVPIATALLIVLFPLRHRLGLSPRRAQQTKESATS